MRARGEARDRGARAREKLDEAAAVFARRYPYHGGFIAGTSFGASDLVGTMGVERRRGQGLRFIYNAGFVHRLDLDELVGVLHHEVNHVLFGHLDLDPSAFEDRDALTIAMEVTANEFVCEPLPGCPVTPAQYPFLKPYEDTLRRYERLVRERGDRGSLPPVSTVDDHGTWNPFDLREGIARRIARGLPGLWGLLSATNPWRGRASGLLLAGRHHFQRPGPAEHEAVKEEVEVAAGPGAIPWHRHLSRFGRGGARVEEVAVLGWPPRRLPHLAGIVPALVHRTGGISVMAVIDTSGSMDGPLLGRVSRELERLSRRYPVTLVECDSAVRATYRYRGPLREVSGRGGTDLRPPFAASVLTRVRPDVVIYFTDGKGRALPEAPRVPVIWCLPEGMARPAPWGEVVRLDFLHATPQAEAGLREAPRRVGVR